MTTPISNPNEHVTPHNKDCVLMHSKDKYKFSSPLVRGGAYKGRAGVAKPSGITRRGRRVIPPRNPFFS